MWEREGDRGGKTVRETVFLDQHISVWYERRKYETVKRTEKHKIHNQILNQWKKWLETLLYSILPNIKYKSKCRLFAFCQNWASEFFFFQWAVSIPDTRAHPPLQDCQSDWSRQAVAPIWTGLLDYCCHLIKMFKWRVLKRIWAGSVFILALPHWSLQARPVWALSPDSGWDVGTLMSRSGWGQTVKYD